MAALSANRDTPALANPPVTSGQTEQVIENAEIMYAGGMMALTSADEVLMASDTVGLRVLGRCPAKVDNTADGETIPPAEHGVFRYSNSSTYAVTADMKGEVCYVEDDQTVGCDSTKRVPAGIVHDVDADGVWVDQTAAALALARRQAAPYIVSKTDTYTITAADCFQGNVVLAGPGGSTGVKEFTLPTAKAGYRVGLKRDSATAADDLTIQAPTGDTVLGSAAAKQVDNTVDAVSGILWIRTVNATAWVLDTPVPADYSSWVINNA